MSDETNEITENAPAEAAPEAEVATQVAAEAAAPAEAASEDETSRGHRKERVGVVVKSSEKTAVVQVSRRVKHKRYGKYINRRKRYAVHDELGVAVGEWVRIRETRPLSKNKRWRVVERAAKQS